MYCIYIHDIQDRMRRHLQLWDSMGIGKPLHIPVLHTSRLFGAALKIPGLGIWPRSLMQAKTPCKGFMDVLRDIAPVPCRVHAKALQLASDAAAPKRSPMQVFKLTRQTERKINLFSGVEETHENLEKKLELPLSNISIIPGTSLSPAAGCRHLTGRFRQRRSGNRPRPASVLSLSLGDSLPL
jgi:hypothetical protein